MRHGVSLIVLSGLFARAAYSQVSPEKEIALGQHLAAEIRFQAEDDREVIGYVEGILKNLSRDESLRLPLKLRVIDSSDLVASALPGGFLLLSSGAILQAENEAELAGLLSHATGHVQAGQSRNAPSTGTGVPVVFVGGPWGSCIRAGESAGRTLVPLNLLPQSDLFESQADLLALGYLTNAGYDPQALVTVFNRWAGTRLDEEVKSKARAGASSTILNTSAFDRIKARLAPPRRVPTLYK